MGGGVVATAGRMGTTATVNKRGEGSLGGVARPQSSIPVEKEAMDVKPEQQKKVKDFELVKEDVGIKLKQYIAERLKAIKKEVDVSKKACQEATLASNGRIDGEGKVPYQSEFVDIMNKRLACLQHLTPEGGASSVTPKHADHELLKSCITDLMAIVAATDKDAETKGQELYKRAHAVNLTDAQNAAAFSGILAHFQVGSEALRVEQDLIDSISKFNGALNIEAGVREIIADRKSKKEPLPTTVLDRTRSLDFIELMGLQIASLTSEHAAKEFKNSIAQEEKRWKELTNAVQKGAKQVSDNIISYERKTANAKTQAASKEQKQKEREAAKRAREEAKQAQDAVKKAVASSHTDNFLLTGSHARLITIKKHEKNDVMGQSANYDFDTSVPYMINDPACMKSLVEQRTVKAAIGLFRIQYPTCNDAKKFGFAYSPCAIDAKDKVRECLLALGPKTKFKVAEADRNGIIAKSLEQVLFHGNTQAFQTICMEKQGLAQLRYQLCGERNVAVIPHAMLEDICCRDGGPSRQENEGIQKFYERAVGAIDQTLLDAVKDINVYRGVVQPGCFLYVPAGCYLLEKTGETHSVCLRTPLLDSTKAACENFNSMVKAFNEVEPESPQAKFWHKIMGYIKVDPASSAKS